MARPITATPKLNSEESKAFLKRMKKDVKVPLRLLPTPKLEEARDLIREHAKNGKQ
jgi:hypothetical protein